MLERSRRRFITELISLVAAPAIVRASNLMPIKQMIQPIYPVGWPKTVSYTENGIYWFMENGQVFKISGYKPTWSVA